MNEQTPYYSTSRIESPFDASDLSDKERVELVKILMETNNDAIITINGCGEVIEWSRAAEEIFLFKREEVIGQRLENLIIPNHLKEAHAKGLANYLYTGVGPVLNKRIEIEAINKNKELFPVELTISPVRFREHLYFTARIRNISQRKKYENQLILTAKETAHREKNSLAIVSAIFRQLAKYSKDINDFNKKFDQWMQSYKTSIEYIALDLNNEGTSLLNRLREEFKPYNNGRNVIIEGEDLIIKRHILLIWSMCIHECITNSIKYGSLFKDEGTIHIKTYIESNEYVMEWIERGGPMPKEQRQSGFGTELLRNGWVKGLGGKFDFKFPPEGFEGKISIALERLK